MKPQTFLVSYQTVMFWWPLHVTMASPSRKAESKQDHLAHKGANPGQIWALVMDLNGSFHHHKLVPVTIQAHNSVYKHWRDYATIIDMSPKLQEIGNHPQKVTLHLFIFGGLQFTRNWFQCNLKASSTTWVTVGLIVDNPSVTTIYHKITTFMATWVHQSSIQVLKNVHQQVFAYCNSSEFKAIMPLKTAMHEKHITYSIRIEILLQGMWEDKLHFCNTREHMTCTTLTTMKSLTNDRPGMFTINFN